ncbi:hypothetical protein Vafri_4881 [Volvox africanus]|uniref:Uncharacterized protein n=1 Tax=Volvox africanus TaxID=51714 RepID=A0A8J4EVB2_9CHLO|nr:hypothetical protein Vafri_4881 [Volvox africanus]
MAEILSARGRAQSRGETVGSNNSGGANTVQSSLSTAGGSLRRPSRLLLSSGPSSGLGQDHAAHTLPPLSPGNNTVSHATHRAISGSSSSRGLVSGGLSSAAGRPDGSNGGASNTSFGTQARSRIGPGSSTSGTGNGAGSGSGGGGGVGGGSSWIGTERRRVQAVMTDQTRGGAVTAGVSSVARTAAAGGGVASTTKGRTPGRPSVRLARGGALVSGATRQQGGRGMGPVAGPGSAAARAAEARAAAASVATALANSDDHNGDGDDCDDFGIYSYIDVSRSSGGGSEPSAGGECSAGTGRALSQTHQMLQNLHTGTEGGGTAAATASGDLNSGGGSPSTSAQLGLRGTMSHVLSLHRPSSPLAAPGPRSPRASASVASTASAGTLPHAIPRPLSSRLDDVSTPPRHQQPQPTQPSMASDPLGLGIGPLSMFGPLAAAPLHTIPHSSALPRPSSSAASRLANASATAAGSTTGFTPGSAAGSGSGHGFDPGARAQLRTSLTPGSAAPGTGAGVLERDLLGSHIVDVTPDSAVRPSSGSSDVATRQPSSHATRGTALRGVSQEPSTSTAATRSGAASQATSSRALTQATAVTGVGPRMQVAAARAAARTAGRTAAPSAAATAVASGALSAAASNMQNGSAAQTSSTTGTSAASEQLAAGNRSRRGLSAAASAALATNAATLSATTNRTIAHHRAPAVREDVQSETAPVGTGRRNNAEAASASITSVAAVSAPGAGAFSLFNPRDPSPLGHAVVGTGGGNAGSAAAVAIAAARRRSSNGPSEGGNSGGAGGVRGVIRQRGTGLDADAIPLRGGLGGRVGVGSRVVAASRAAAGATRLLYDSGNAFSSDDDSYGDGDSNGSSEPGGAIRQGHARMPQRLFRVHLNPQAAEATTFGPTRPMGPSRPPLPHAHQHQTPAQVQQHNRLHRRSNSDDAGVVGGALVIGSGSGGFQERFLEDLRRRDAQRAALMQLLMIGGEEELLRQAEEEQLALGEPKGLCPELGAGCVR